MNRACAACVAAAMALCGCAEMSAGDCTAKGLCAWTDAETTPLDAADGAPRIDASLDATQAPDSVADTALDQTVASDGPSDGAEEAGDALSDAGDAGDGADDAGDAPSDAGDAADVASSACRCIASVPPGWSGPVALAEATGAPPLAIAPCVTPYGATAYDGNADPNAPVTQCGCTCGAATNVQCPAPIVALFSDSACSASCGGATVVPGGCTAVSTGGCGAAVYARARAPAPAGGSCPPQPTTTVPPIQWGRAARACALPSPATQGTCGANLLCAPAPSPPFSGHLCAVMAGDLPCHGGSVYSVRHVYYGGATDGRGCSACTCGAPDGGTCSGSFTTYNASGCSLQTSTFPLSSSCDPVQIATSSLGSTLSGPSGSACAPAAVQPVGAIVPTQPTTVCCLP